MGAEIGKLALKEQNQILQDCINQNVPLADMLNKKDLTYDNLRYISYADFDIEKNNCQSFDDVTRLESTIPAISFFSGAGGLDIGFEYAGFNNLASIEFNNTFCNTLRSNNPNKLVIGPPEYSGDISDRENLYEVLTNVVGIKPDFEGVFHGGPPCQSFSIAANQRFKKESDDFKRKGFADPVKGTLLFDYLWFVSQFRPKAFLIENVDGIMDCDEDGKICTALNQLTASGYTVCSPIVVNAANYGVPQNRLRWLILGTRSKKTIDVPNPNDYTASCYCLHLRNILKAAC